MMGGVRQTTASPPPSSLPAWEDDGWSIVEGGQAWEGSSACRWDHRSPVAAAVVDDGGDHGGVEEKRASTNHPSEVLLNCRRFTNPTMAIASELGEDDPNAHTSAGE